MTQILNVKSGEKVLEIGTGSGYQAAILAELTDYVYTIEIKEKLAKSAKDRLNGLGYHNVNVKFGDGYYGWEEFAPFDAIIITAAANHISPSLVKQLKEGGRLLIPLGSTRYWQTLTMGIKRKGELMDIKHYTDVVFVPMTGEIQRKR
jgi:protein-L-isoaspartate(D-aspartate) O-methyltransferase